MTERLKVRDKDDYFHQGCIDSGQHLPLCSPDKEPIRILEVSEYGIVLCICRHCGVAYNGAEK